MRRLAIFDLDGTITRSDTLLRYVAGFMRRRPARLWRVSLCVLPVLQFCVTGDRGRLKGGIIRATLGGLSRADIEAWNQPFIAQLLGGGLYAEALEQVNVQRAAGAHLVLLSASPDLYVPAIAAALGFDEAICTQVRWRSDNRLHGALASANRRGEEKVRCVQALLQTWQPEHSCAYGNSSADLPHMRLVSEGVYVNGPGSETSIAGNIRRVRWHQPAVALGATPDHNHH